ncbi:MAG: rhodanese-like domain-containing protein [Bacteroides sp.]
MNQILAGLFVAFYTLCSCQQKGNYVTLPIEEFAVLIEDQEVQRLDVRTTAEYTEGHIPGALNLNVLDHSFAAMADSILEKKAPVALYCRSGKRSKKAAALLSAKGYRVYELESGFNGWTGAGKAVDK